MDRRRIVIAGVVAGSVGVLSASEVRTAIAADAAAIDPGSFAPRQAWIFDGSTDASAAYEVALGAEGFLVENAGPSCGPDPAPTHLSVANDGALGAGVWQPPALVYNFDSDILSAPPAASSSPFDAGSIQTDCDAVPELDAIQRYLAETYAKVLQIQSQTSMCVADVKALQCALLLTVEAAPVLSGLADLLTCDSEVPSFGSGFTGAGFQCGFCAGALSKVPGNLDSAKLDLTTCQDVEAQLAAELQAVPKIVSSQGGLLSCQQQGIKQDALDLPARAEAAYADLPSHLGIINDATAVCTLGEVTAGCADCEPGLSSIPPVGLNVSSRRLSIRDVVGVLNDAAARRPDAASQARLRSLARRLDGLPEHRVSRATFRSSAPFGEALVALQSPAVADDGVSPLAIVLTGLARGAPRPPTSDGADEAALLDAMRAFRAMLAPAVTAPTSR